MSTKNNQQGLVILFDDERSFVPGFRDHATVVRTLEEARELFEELRSSGQRVSELWLDFVLQGTDSTDEALREVPGELIDRAIFHSNAWAARDLLSIILRRQGFSGELEPLWKAFPEETPFS